MNTKHIKKTLTLQYSQHTCGLACLTSIVKFHGGTVNQEQLLELSGTTLQGTSLFGLFETAENLGFNVDGYEADLENLKKIETPVILHVTKNGNIEHYIVCYGFHKKFMIGDPEWGVTQYSEEELDAIWQSKTMLVLNPNDNFLHINAEKKKKQKQILALSKPDIPIQIISTIIGVIAAVLGIPVVIFLGKIIDKLLPAHNINAIIWGSLTMSVLLIARAGLLYMRSLLNAGQSKDFGNRIFHYFFHKILYLPKSFFCATNSSELTVRINDIERIQKTILGITNNLIIDAITIMSFVCTMFFYSWITAILILASIPLFLVLVHVFKEKICTHQQYLLYGNAVNESKFSNTLHNVDEVKIFNRYEEFHSDVTDIYATHQDRKYNLTVIGDQFSFFCKLIGVILAFSILALSSVLVLHGKLQTGEFITILILTMVIIPALYRLTFANIQFQETKAAFDKMLEITFHQSEHEETRELEKTIINNLFIKELSFSFPGSVTFLQNISLSVEKNQIITLFGETGCGKSTIIKLLQRLYLPESIQIYINGEDWEKWSIPAWRENVAIVPQNIHVFNNTIANNIVLGDVRNEHKQFTSFCKRFGFDKYFEQLPQGYLTILTEEGVNISAGQLQIIALARALYKRPQILLLDEPTCAMDHNTECFVLNLLDKLKKQMIIIIATHKVEVARKTDCIYIINNGTIEAKGTHSELIEYDNLYKLSFESVSVPYEFTKNVK